MSNGKYVYRVTVLNNQHLGPMGLEAQVIKTGVYYSHRVAIARAKDQRDLYGRRTCRDKEIKPLGETDLGTISIEITRERFHR